MVENYCGANCKECQWKENCKGCKATLGKPFGEPCPLASCAKALGNETCANCGGKCKTEESLLSEINALHIEGMPEIKELYALPGSFVNLAYVMPDGSVKKLLDDNAVYLGTQVEKPGTDRCFGIAANERFILVSEYGTDGRDPVPLKLKMRFSAQEINL